MAEQTNIEKLETARDRLANVYKDEATDDIMDNGNLIKIHEAIIKVEEALYELKQREQG